MNATEKQQRVVQKLAAAESRERLRGLAPAHAEFLRQAMRLLAAGDTLTGGQWLLQVLRLAPDHPEVLRWAGIRHASLREWPAAVDCLTRAAAQRPRDFKVLLELGSAQENDGDCPAALRTLLAARDCASGAQEWQALSLEFDRQGHYEASLEAIGRLLQLAPASAVGLLQRSRCLKALGQAERAAADCRALIAAGREPARAWFALVDLKTIPLTETELARLEQAAAQPFLDSEHRLLLDFARGKALEDAGRVDRAFDALRRANDAARASHPWDSSGFARTTAAVRAAFEVPPTRARPQGREVIFLVGLPRSGTTLVEQVLASHSMVEGASELPTLNQVIEEESRRRSQPFPAWVATTSGADWRRLGQRYLTLTARWRTQKPIATDKLPENWLLAGAAMAMLPDARIVDSRRDAVETCWSCFKQLFGPGRVGFTYDFGDLAAYWHAYDSLARFWADTAPRQFRVQQYEALVADPETQIRQLLAFCDLPFEPGCLQFQSAQRAIRTPSALQVRQPMVRPSTPAAGYGELLNELRALLRPAAQRAEAS